MQFKDIIGQTSVKEDLINSVKNNRVSHAQLFLGPQGSGNLPLAFAFAQFINCEDRTPTDSCGQCESCSKSLKRVHPDIHFSYPVVTKKTGGKPKSTDFINEWRNAIDENSYMNINQWMQFIDAENRQANISVNECQDIIRKLNFKTFESTYKVLIMWMPEYLKETGNVLLKIIEEPPEKTLFLLVAENQDLILNTILSRTQLVKIKKLADKEITSTLTDQHNLSEEEALRITFLADGNYNETLKLLNDSENNNEKLFKDWFSFCLNNKTVELVEWIESFANLGRENQKNFFKYTLSFFKELITMELSNNIVRLQETELSFARQLTEILDFEKAERIITLFNKSYYYIERNANPKILMLNLSIQISKILKNKKVVLI